MSTGDPQATIDGNNACLIILRAIRLYEHFDGTLAKLCIETWQAMDRDAVFGTGQRRERVVIGVCVNGGDTSDTEFMTWAEQVNPPTVVERLRALTSERS